MSIFLYAFSAFFCRRISKILMENLNDFVRICGREFARTDANVGSSWNIIGAKTRHVKAGFFCGVIAKSMQANGVCDCFCVEIIAVNNDIFRARKHKNIVDALTWERGNFVVKKRQALVQRLRKKGEEPLQSRGLFDMCKCVTSAPNDRQHRQLY